MSSEQDNNDPYIWSIFNDMFWLTMAGICAGMFGVLVNGVIKSHCQEISCCFGMFKCQRDVDKVDTDPESPVEVPPVPTAPPARPNRLNNNLNKV